QDMVQLICYAQRQVVRSAAYVQRIKFLNMQVDGVQERLNSSGISLQYESFDRVKAAERNDCVTTSAAHRQLLLFTLDAERQTTYPVVDDTRTANDDEDGWVCGGTTKAWDPELLEALRPQTAPELQGVPSRPFTPRSQMTKPPSPPKRETHDVEAVARTFNFARQCAAKKLPMPNLGTFTLGDESRLKLSNWSLGDDPLMALASSPLRDNVAVVEEGNFAGNRLTNKGVDAIVSSLGSDLTTLNLSASRASNIGSGALAQSSLED
ncbi:unnamed protein product, partial [Cladocopium goreaui]